MKKIGVIKKRELEEVELTGFVAREPQIKQSKDGDYFKVLTLGVYEDQDQDLPTWYNLTANKDCNLHKGDNACIVCTTWKRNYISKKTGEPRSEMRGNIKSYETLI